MSPNKATGQRLDVAYAGTALNGVAKPASGATYAATGAVVGGEMQDWAFSATYKDAANILEISVKTLEAHIATAVRKLRESLAKEIND